MGYFSNGSEGEGYYAEFCSKCVHDEGGCTVWLLHLMSNYDECNNDDSMLHKLIPREGLGNGKCSMFHRGKVATDDSRPARPRNTCPSCEGLSILDGMGRCRCGYQRNPLDARP